MVSFLLRRLHDLNKSAWYSLRILIPVYGLYIIFYILFAAGTKGENKYGSQLNKQTVKEIFGFQTVKPTPQIP